MKGSNNARYVHLDGLRGVLAIAVVIHHFAFATQLHWFNKAWISVDAFFILSGFVIAHSYVGKIQQGMGLKAFSLARLGRLYPVYFFGLMLGVAASISSSLQPAPDTLEQLSAVGLGLVVLPYLNQLSWPAVGHNHIGDIFPLNAPAWSLFFELFVNLVFFAWLRFGQRLNLCLVVLGLGVAHVLASQTYGLHSGWGTSNVVGGFIRVGFFFFLGVAIHRFHQRLSVRSAWMFLAGLAAMLTGFLLHNHAVDYLLLFAVAPLTILLGSCAPSAHGRSAEFMNWLGGISYPIYITHFPLGMILRDTLLSDVSAEAFVVLSTLVSLAVAHVVAQGETSVRKRWRRRSHASSSATP